MSPSEEEENTGDRRSSGRSPEDDDDVNPTEQIGTHGTFDISSEEDGHAHADVETGGKNGGGGDGATKTATSDPTEVVDTMTATQSFRTSPAENAAMIVEEGSTLPQDIHRRRNVTNHSLHDDADNDASFSYSFRMPQQQKGAASIKSEDDNSDMATSTCFPRGGSATIPSDYKFVLDNYIEYADNTKIPRLRGENVDSVRSAIHSSHPLALCAAVSASCCLVYSISNFAPNLRADISQAIVITMVLATFPEVAASAGAGAFVGMASRNTIPHHGWLALLALVTSITWLCFHKFNLLVGYGGRLGTCAFIAMNVTVLVFVMPAGQVPWSMYGSTDSLWKERLKLVPSVLTVLASTFLSAVGGWVRLKSKLPLNPVQAPTTIALLCMLILEPTGFKYTGNIDEGLAVGSFVAMASTSPQFLPTTLDFTMAGFLAGLWILLLDPFFLEFGGKKGFTSFCGFATYMLLTKLVLRRRRST